jgi:hypothetical protein
VKWEGQTVAVMASGPSMSQESADLVRHLPRIAVNSTYRLAPDADVIYAGDAKWWNANPEALACPGLKASIEIRPGVVPADMPTGVRVFRNTGRDGFDPSGGLRTLGNSGAQALQIAVHSKAARVLLLGFDYRGEHWHGPHPRSLGNPTVRYLAKCVVRFRSLARSLPAGVDVLNCSPESALDCFPKVRIEDVA